MQHLRLARDIRREARRAGAIVHCGRALPEGVAAFFARQFGGPPYVCWAHGEDIGTALSSRELSAVTRLVYRHAQFAVANSRNTAAMLRDCGVESERIHLIYPGVDPARFHPGIDGRAVRAGLVSPDDILLLSVGRLQRRKGHDLMIEALAAVGPTGPAIEVRHRGRR